MKKNIILGLIAVILVAIAVKMYMPVGEKVDPLSYFDEFSGNKNNLVYEDQRVDAKEPVKVIGDEIYVSYDFIAGYVGGTIFYDKSEGILTVTDAKNVLRLYPDKDEALLNKKKVKAPYKIVKEGEIVYVPAKLVKEKTGVEVIKGKDGRLFVATNLREAQTTAVVKGKRYLRTHKEKKATIVETLTRGSKVTVYGEEDGYYRVRSENGIIGYLETSALKNEQKTEPEAVSEAAWELNPLGKKVKLVWDQVSQIKSDWSSTKYKNVKKANVISPTWFQFEDAKGTLRDYGDADYVKTAHAKGLKVWPILSHNFNNTALTAKILTSTEKRQYVIDQIIANSKKYGFDGINIDIENIQVETSEVWVQFMRELYPQLKNAGLVVTVDVYMPSNWSSHYERAKIAKLCDYFMVMAYDQHWSGSEEAGSVSEISWVDEGLEKNLEEVPKEKLVLGIPFYTRLWKETANGLESNAYDMKSAEKLLKQWKVDTVLDEVSGQNYAEIEKNGGLYRIWMEDEMSIGKRVSLIQKYDLAGYGAWRLGMEKEEVWNELAKVK